MGYYTNLFDAHKVSAHLAYGGSAKSPDITSAFLHTLHTSWKAMYDKVHIELGGYGQDDLYWIPTGDESSALSGLEDSWHKWDAIVDKTIGAVKSDGMIAEPYEVWSYLNGLATNMDLAYTYPSNSVAFDEWLSRFTEPFKELGSDALTWVKVAAIAAVAVGGYLVYKEIAK